jgi:hypothetical protein
MKKVISLVVLMLLGFSLNAKKVKFAVDMTSYTISPNGIHLISDFQVIAGYGTMDWDPTTMQLAQEGSSNVYSIVVDIPAFQKYEFKFVNGIQTYEAEFVPDPARVGYNFNDNRWMYVDSLANDTSFMGAIQFSNNSPIGKTLIRYKVDMSTAGTISPNGVHVGTSYQSSPYDASKIRLYSFGSNVYEIINYVNSNTYSYIFYNGNSSGTTETVPGSCAVSGKRTITLSTDSILNTVCFSSCTQCVGAGLSENTISQQLFSLFPNPAKELVYINSASAIEGIELFDNTGKKMKDQRGESELQVGNLNPGIYLVKVNSVNGNSQVKKLIITR